LGADFRDMSAAADAGHQRARLAIDVFTTGSSKYVGAYAACSAASTPSSSPAASARTRRVRARCATGSPSWAWCSTPSATRPRARATRVGVVDVAAAALADARAGGRHRRGAHDRARGDRAGGRPQRGAQRAGAPIPVGVSVRHVHLSRADCDALFGPGYELTHRRDVTQKGQYVTRETVDLVGPKGEMRGVAIINPLRRETQVEVAAPTPSASA
jgi:acetate kinase